MRVSNKTMVFGIVFLLAAGISSAEVLDSFGSVSGTVEVVKPLQIVEVNADTAFSGHSGEYVILQQKGDVDFGNWNLTTVNDAGKVIDFSGKKNLDYIVLVDNESAVKSTPDNYLVVETGTITDRGLADEGEILELIYSPENVTVQTVDYSGSECGSSQAYQVENSGCGEKSIQMEEAN